MIGLFGDIRFRVSDETVLTFRNLKREISATWNTTNRIGLKPLTEYGGPELQMASFEIALDAGLGVRPKRLLESLENMTESGTAEDLVLEDEEWERIPGSLQSVLRPMTLYYAGGRFTGRPCH